MAYCHVFVINRGNGRLKPTLQVYIGSVGLATADHSNHYKHSNRFNQPKFIHHNSPLKALSKIEAFKAFKRSIFWIWTSLSLSVFWES